MAGVKKINVALATSFSGPMAQKVISWAMLANKLSRPKVGPKSGAVIVPAKIASKKRNTESIQEISILVYDIDNKSNALTSSALKRLISESDLRAIFHSTHSSRPEHQRFRLFLEVSRPIKPSEYKTVAKLAARKLGIEPDPSAIDLARCYYLPRCERGRENEYIFERIEGKAVDVDEYVKLSEQQSSSNVVQLSTIPVNNSDSQTPAETKENAEVIREMLNHISPDTNRDEWRDIVWSICSLNWKASEALAREWSQRSKPHWDAEEKAQLAERELLSVVASYDTARNNAIGLGTLVHKARQNGWKGDARLAQHEFKTTPLNDSESTKSRFNILNRTQLGKLPPAEWIVKGILPSTGLAAMYGPPGCGKSFLALDICNAIANGASDWFGRKCKQRDVIYIALEGGGGIKKRVIACEQHTGFSCKNLLFVLDRLNLRSYTDMQALTSEIRQHASDGVVIVIDTLNQASPGSDENSSVDMGEIIAAANALYSELNGLVMLIHHSGKNTSKGLRGHSSLLAAVDVAIEVKKETTYRSWSLSKAKDADDSEYGYFDLKNYNTGYDVDGDRETSCAVEQVFAAPQSTQRKPPTGKHQVPVYSAIITDLESRELTYDECVQIGVGSLPDVDASRRKSRAKDIVSKLISDGHLIQEDKKIIKPKTDSPKPPPL